MQHSFPADGEHAREDALLEAGAEHDRVVFLIHVRGPGLEEPGIRRARSKAGEPSASMCPTRTTFRPLPVCPSRDASLLLRARNWRGFRGARTLVRDIERRDTRRTRYEMQYGWKEGRPALSLSLLGVDDDGDDDGGDSGGQAVATTALTSLFP